MLIVGQVLGGLPRLMTAIFRKLFVSMHFTITGSNP